MNNFILLSKIFLIAGTILMASASFLVTVLAAPNTMNITSPAFSLGQDIPIKYTCDGGNVNPTINISGTPEEARSLVIIVDDPDAPNGTFTHWLLWNISPENADILENKLPENAVTGKNSAGKIGYIGPCPPSGTHRYYFRLFALDNILDLPEGSSRQELEKAMERHIISRGELMGKYSRS